METLIHRQEINSENIVIELWKVNGKDDTRIKFLPGCRLPIEQMKTQIFSAFPMSGKSLTNLTYDISKYQYMYHFERGILDFHLSTFKWFSKDPHVKNPDFPANYVDFVEFNIGKYACIFISSDREVRREMKKRGIDYTLFYPRIECVEEIIERSRRDEKRNSKFLTSYTDNVLSEISDVLEDDFPKKIMLDYPSQFCVEFQYFLNDGMINESGQEF